VAAKSAKENVMGRDIQLDPEHGLNPSLIQCFFCMEDKGVALLGRLNPMTRKAFEEAGIGRGAEAPRKLCLDMEPCDECKGYMDQGVILVSVRDEDNGKENPLRTGCFVVVKDEFITLSLDSEAAKAILESRFAFVPDSAWNKLGLPRGAVESNG
jgi:hypothetical protein